MALTFTATAKYALRRLTGGNLVSDIDAGFIALADDIDSLLAPSGQGTLAARPVSTSGSPSGKAGQTYLATDDGSGGPDGTLYRDYGTGWAVVQIAPPVGAILEYAGAGDPSTAWLLADGRSLLRASYAACFTALGGAASPWGLPDGTHFNLPDYRGRTGVGLDDMGTAAGAAGRLPNSNRTRGQNGGEERHTLSIPEMPSHQHHIPSWNAAGGGGLVGFVYAANLPNTAAAINDDAVGGGGAHNNMQPYNVANRIIRVL